MDLSSPVTSVGVFLYWEGKKERRKGTPVKKEIDNFGVLGETFSSPDVWDDTKDGEKGPVPKLEPFHLET